ncbi:MAG: 50S ribosomal protein L17 [Marinilabiliales bacterium]|nr:MAG: 50S ribosomal protein L17 [Marinilabiliales bacterium]
MRHRKSFNHLGRTSSHRKAMLSNMASSLILHKRITTTVAKAKALRSYIEPLITKAKDDTTHSRRIVFSYLRDKYAVTELFRNVAAKIMERPGGYTRVIKLGKRQGDSAEMAMIELVDYNELLLTDKSPKKAKSTRRRRGGSKKTTVAETVAKTETAAKEEKAAVKEEPVAKAEAKSDDVAEEKAPEVKETPETKAEEKKEEKKD